MRLVESGAIKLNRGELAVGGGWWSLVLAKCGLRRTVPCDGPWNSGGGNGVTRLPAVFHRPAVPESTPLPNNALHQRAASAAALSHRRRERGSTRARWRRAGERQSLGRPLHLSIALLVAALAGSGVAHGHGRSGGVRRYRTDWFSVEYPAACAVRPSLHSKSSGGYDSAFFDSRDGKVSFYVFAPQWDGEPADFAFDSSRESVEDTRAKQIAEDVVEKTMTVCAKDHSYCRTWTDLANGQHGTRTVVGIKYRDVAAREKYRAAYERFKSSLVQYAD
jgi:hypothetical protein